MKYLKKTLWVFLIAAAMLLIPMAVFAEGETIPDGWNADRTMYYQNGQAVTGLFKAKMSDDVGALFYANDNGKVRKTPGIIKVDKTKTRYLRTQDEEGHWGFRKVGDTDKNTYSYLIGDNGEGAIVETAKLYKTKKGRTYCVQENGTVRTTQGLVKVKGVTYYVNKYGYLKASSGWVYPGGKKYRVNSKGVVRTKEGQFKVGKYRYVIPTGSDGAVRTKLGVAKANGKLYFVRKENGHLGGHKAYKLNGKTYHVNKYGLIKIGKHKWKDGKYYYTVKRGHLKTKTAILTRNGRRFLVKKGGLIVTNQKFKYKGKYYIANKYGNIYTNMFTWKGNWYLANEKGVLHTKAGIVEYQGNDYFVTGGGSIVINKMFYWKGKLYASDGNGHLQTGFFRRGNSYYFADADHSIHTSEEILKYKGRYYYNKKGGGLARNTWVNFNNKHYYAGDDCAFLTSRFTMNGFTFNPKSNGEISDEEYKQLFPDPDEDKEEQAEDVNDNTNSDSTSQS